MSFADTHRLTGTAREVAKDRLREIANDLETIERHRQMLTKNYQALRDEQARLNAMVYKA